MIFVSFIKADSGEDEGGSSLYEKKISHSIIGQVGRTFQKNKVPHSGDQHTINGYGCDLSTQFDDAFQSIRKTHWLLREEPTIFGSGARFETIHCM